MAIQEVRASGLEYLALATELLQRARLGNAEAGVWEAADLQWWWRTPRRSDSIDQLFWIDHDGPVAGVVLTEWDRAWGAFPSSSPASRPSPVPPSGRALSKPSTRWGSRRSKCSPMTTTPSCWACSPRPAS